MNLLEKALQITAGFEGGSYDNLTGSFDGQGLSAGILQWNYGQGSLQPLLKEYIVAYGEPEGFPVSILPSASMSNEDAVAFSMQMQDPLSKYRLKPEWKAAWKAFLSSPGFVAVQEAHAGSVGQHANVLMKVWGVTSPTAFCFFFDICVQNGGMKGLTPVNTATRTEPQPLPFNWGDANAKLWSVGVVAAPPNPEQVLLHQALDARLASVKPEFQNDMAIRKMTIIMNQGWVHGRYYDFRELLNG